MRKLHPLAAPIPHRKARDAAEPVDDHRRPHAIRPPAKTDAQHMAEANSPDEHRRDGGHHREFHVVRGTQHIREDERQRPKEEATAVVDHDQPERHLASLRRHVIVVQPERRHNEQQDIPRHVRHVSHLHDLPHIEPHLLFAACSDALPDNRDARQTERAADHAAEIVQIVRDGVRRHLRRAEFCNHADDNQPPELEHAVFDATRNADVQNLVDQTAVQRQPAMPRDVNRRLAIRQQIKQKHHRRKPREQRRHRRADHAVMEHIY